MQIKVLNARKLLAVKIVRTVIYSTTAAAIFYTLYSEITKTYDHLLSASLGVIVVEYAVFLGNGMRCPLAVLAKNMVHQRDMAALVSSQSESPNTRWELLERFCRLGLVVLALNCLNLR